MYAVRYSRLIAAVLLLCALGAKAQQLIPGYSDDVKEYDVRELPLLPEYCKFTQDFREKVPGGSEAGQWEHWTAVLGPAFVHLHHYCWGLMKANRGFFLARDAFARTHFLNDAIREYDYVITRSSPDFVLLPEVLTKKGQALLRLGRVPAAMGVLERAMDLKPDYWPPYAYASDYYLDVGDRDRAREYLARGIAAAPTATALQRRLKEIDTAARGKTQSKSR